jgi:hypothetical protein
MKKEFAIVVLIVLTVMIFLSGGTNKGLIGIPSLSPLFPDFAPFDATVTVLSNSPPIILDLDTQIYVCEDESADYHFNVEDVDVNLNRVEINPPSLFFTQRTSTPGVGETIYGYRIFSGIMGKGHIGSYSRTISAFDDEGESDPNDPIPITIDVIEINHAPVVDNVGVQTVYTVGDDSSFLRHVLANDVEDGNQDAGNLVYDLEFLNSLEIFGITSNGILNFTPSYHLDLETVILPITYNLRLCVSDLGISYIHPEILNECGQDGSAIQVCQTFSISAVDDNRAPIITSYYSPDLLNLSARGTEEIYFNISGRDPDDTIPDTYWYVDDKLAFYDPFVEFSEFRYTFECGVYGVHNVSVDITDGLLNTSLFWNISLEFVDCPSSPSGGGGGGGGFSKKECVTAWGCNDWNVCQDIEASVESGALSEGDFKNISDRCRLDFFKEDCGYQLRDCFDFNYCNTTREEPEPLNHCFYVENPSCKDGVKNCHSGGCEILTDCGGPCGACPTCSDGKENQGEKGKDCGGPCPNACIIGPPFFERAIVRYTLIGAFSLLGLIILILLLRIILAKRKIGEDKKATEQVVVQRNEIVDEQAERDYIAWKKGKIHKNNKGKKKRKR